MPSTGAWTATALARNRPFLVAAVVAALCAVTVVGLATAFALRNDGRYSPHFDMRPASASESVLACGGDPDAFWASSRTGAPGTTDRCVFTGDFTTGRGVTEQQVRAKCNARADCGGYTVARTVRYASNAVATMSVACESAEGGVAHVTDTCTGALPQGYNSSCAEYTLVSRAAARALVRASDAELGQHRETTLVTHVRG